MDAYVACAELLLPSPIILRNRLSQAIAREQRNWSLLALLRACERLEHLALSVLIPEGTDKAAEDLDNKQPPAENLGDKLSRYFFPTQNGAQELTGSGIIRFLFDLGFASKESTDDVSYRHLQKSIKLDFKISGYSVLPFARSCSTLDRRLREGSRGEHPQTRSWTPPPSHRHPFSAIQQSPELGNR